MSVVWAHHINNISAARFVVRICSTSVYFQMWVHPSLKTKLFSFLDGRASSCLWVHPSLKMNFSLGGGLGLWFQVYHRESTIVRRAPALTLYKRVFLSLSPHTIWVHPSLKMKSRFFSPLIYGLLFFFCVVYTTTFEYGVATISRLLKIIRLFGEYRSLL